MEISFEAPIAVFNLSLYALIAIIPIAGLCATRKGTSGQARAHAYSVRARLPFGSESTASTVAARVRAQIRANLWAVLGVIAITAPLLFIPGFLTSPQSLWVVTVTVLMCALSVAAVVVNVRAQLFTISPDAPRVAHLRDLTVRDYLQPWRRLPGPLLLTAAAASVLAFWIGSANGLWHAPAPTATLIYASMVLASGVAVATRFVEARVLAQPRRAHDELELAWTDIFRADTLGALRLSLSVAAWLPLGLSASFLLLDAVATNEPTTLTMLQQFPWWGVSLLQVLHAFGQGTMPGPLYPPGLRPATPPHTVAVGGHA